MKDRCAEILVINNSYTYEPDGLRTGDWGEKAWKREPT